jgi:hypothetical protein
MSLIKMLSLARSLRGEGDLKTAYQLTQDNLMPDFSRSSLRPVPSREEPIGSGAGCARSVVVRELGLPRGGRSSQEKGKVMQEQQDEMLVNSSSRSGISGQGSSNAGVPVQRARWLSGRTSPRATLRADSKGQLSLEFVKVVRNDLSDSDLELVPARPLVGSAPKRVAAGAAPGLEAVEPEPSRWSRFTARIFGSGNPP